MHRVDGNDRVRIRRACTHFGGDPNRFHELLFGRSLFQCELGVSTNAIRALRHVRDRNRNELLGFRRQRTVGKDALAERPESAVDLRRKLASLLRQLLGSVGIQVIFSSFLLSILPPRPCARISSHRSASRA